MSCGWPEGDPDPDRNHYLPLWMPTPISTSATRLVRMIHMLVTGSGMTVAAMTESVDEQEDTRTRQRRPRGRTV